MAISYQINSYGLLDVWRNYTLESIWLFNQISGLGAPLLDCSVYIQADREAHARALVSAFNRMSVHLGYFPLPIYAQETIKLRKGVPYSLQNLVLKRGYVEAYGQRNATVIQAAATVAYSDTDNDNVDDLATITVNTTVAADEIQVFFRVADGAPSAGDERWQIQPLQVVVSGGVATIAGHRALFTSPVNVWNVPYEVTDPNIISKHSGNTQTNSDFVTAVDVYRVFTDDTTPVEFQTDPIFLGRTSLDAYSNQTGVVLPMDNQIGTFKVRNPSCACPEWPEQIVIYYKSGYPLNYGTMDTDLADALTRLANTLHPYELPDELCDRSRAIWARDRRVPSPQELQPDLVSNPFGIEYIGQLNAWKIVRDRALGFGAKVN